MIKVCVKRQILYPNVEQTSLNLNPPGHKFNDMANRVFYIIQTLRKCSYKDNLHSNKRPICKGFVKGYDFLTDIMVRLNENVDYAILNHIKDPVRL